LKCLTAALLPQDSYDLAGDPLVGVGFLPTIRISHNESTKEAKWDSNVFVEACMQQEGRQCWWSESSSLHLMSNTMHHLDMPFCNCYGSHNQT